jgi:hypothetical protein
MGDGADPFGLRERIWSEVMEDPLEASGVRLPWTVNYLLALGRRPHIVRLRWSTALDAPADQVRSFFHSYFGVFGCPATGVGRAIDRALEPHLRGSTVYVEGEMAIAAVWWDALASEGGSKS